MNTRAEKLTRIAGKARPTRWLQQRRTLLAVLLALASFASPVRAETPAEGIAQLTVTARPVTPIDSVAKLREQIQAKAEIAAWQTQLSVEVDLSLRLGNQHRELRLAAIGRDERG